MPEADRYPVLEHGGHVAAFRVSLLYDLGHLVGVDVECEACDAAGMVAMGPADVGRVLVEHAARHAPASAELVDRSGG